jgi:hypothetical protein
MPRKTKTPTNTGPKQGDVARLIQDSYDVFANELLSELLSSTDLTREKLIEIRPSVNKVKERMKNNTIDSLLKFY